MTLTALLDEDEDEDEDEEVDTVSLPAEDVGAKSGSVSVLELA